MLSIKNKKNNRLCTILPNAYITRTIIKSITTESMCSRNPCVSSCSATPLTAVDNDMAYIITIIVIRADIRMTVIIFVQNTYHIVVTEIVNNSKHFLHSYLINLSFVNTVLLKTFRDRVTF